MNTTNYEVPRHGAFSTPHSRPRRIKYDSLIISSHKGVKRVMKRYLLAYRLVAINTLFEGAFEQFYRHLIADCIRNFDYRH